ncbi:MAG: FAD-binding protein [Nitrososphaerota archaeon]|jgi:succinate dehydrogenase/fumarate reductase flavoprotein subunit|nr:FAD-binding protein [Nitrososphaerota archaeon]MDG6923626.1 FAD-binding protein [Nitrososphaerota archaeon]
MLASEEVYDVLVVGTGVAGLTSAISAASVGQKILTLEKAPMVERGQW